MEKNAGRIDKKIISMIENGLTRIINQVNSECGSNKINLYDFIELYCQAYDSFKNEYENLKTFDFGEKVGMEVCDWVCDPRTGYRFLSIKFSEDLPKSGANLGFLSTEITPPGEEYNRFMIVERDGKVAAYFTDKKNEYSITPASDVPPDVLSDYLNLYGKYHQLFSVPNDVVVENELKGIKFTITFQALKSSLRTFNFTKPGNIGIYIEASIDPSENTYGGEYRVYINVNSSGVSTYSTHIGVQNVNRYLSPSDYERMLKSIYIDCRCLSGYGKKNFLEEFMSKTSEKSTLELAAGYLIELDNYYQGIDLCGEFRKSAAELTETFGGNEDDSMSLYEFIASFYEAYKAFREEYEKLGVLNLGKSTTIGFRDFVGDDNYKFFSAAILRDNHLDKRDTKTTDILVPSREYRYFAIRERDGVVSGRLLGSFGADSAWCPVDLDPNILKAYLDLFGKYHQLFELSKHPGVVLEKENAKVCFDFNTNFSSIEGISGIEIEFSCGDCTMGITIDFNREKSEHLYLSSARYKKHLIKERIPREFLDEMLHSIRISFSYLKGYKGEAAKGLIKTNSEI